MLINRKMVAFQITERGARSYTTTSTAQPPFCSRGVSLGVGEAPRKIRPQKGGRKVGTYLAVSWSTASEKVLNSIVSPLTASLYDMS